MLGVSGNGLAADGSFACVEDPRRRQARPLHRPPSTFSLLHPSFLQKQRPIGGDGRRVTVPVIYFNHPLFGDLQQKAERVYGYDHSGRITLPCGISEFERVQTRIATMGGGWRGAAKLRFSLLNLRAWVGPPGIRIGWSARISRPKF